MAVRRRAASALVAVLAGAGLALAAPGVAGADGETPIAITCTNVPILGSINSVANVTATDDVDPVVAGGTVVNSLVIPVPVSDDSLPIAITLTEVKVTVPIPSGVTVNNIVLGPSSFSGQTWAISGSNVVVTLTGSVKIGGGSPSPTTPTVTMTTTVAGPPRTVEWKVPTSITAKGSYFLGSVNVTCIPDVLSTTLISTTVVNPNQAPTADDQSVEVDYQTPKPITLTGSDPEGSPLTFAVATPPAHGDLTGTAPNLTYIPDAGFSGPDSFTFTASDGSLSDTGTVSIAVGEAPSEPGVAFGDYDGDGDTDRAVFRSESGGWFIEGQETVYLGLSSDIPVPADYDGDGITDRAVFRPSSGAWYIDGEAPVFLGVSSDIPVPGDYDGDGAAEIAVFRPSSGAWYIDGEDTQYFGLSSDVPVPGDYDGDGVTDRAVWRPSVGAWFVDGAETQYLGLSTDVPVPGDYDGDGTTDRAAWRPAAGGWYIDGADTQYLGLSTDVPVPGDYAGDGSTDRGVWRPPSGGWYVDGQSTVFSGLASDTQLVLPYAIARLLEPAAM